MTDSELSGRYNEPGAEGLLRLIQAGRISRRQVLTRGLALGLSVPVLSALIAACGSDEDEDPTATAATSGEAMPHQPVGTVSPARRR